jgi:hypothetical protein
MSDYVINLDGSESVGPQGIYLIWGHGWHSQTVETEHTLQEALQAYWAWDGSEYGSPEYIEGPAGVVPEAEVDAWVRAAETRCSEQSRARREALIGAGRFSVQLREHGSNQAVNYDEFDTLADAIDCVRRLAKPGRCRVTRTVFTESGRWSTTNVVIDWDGNTVEEQGA